jgi:N-formylglutamate amidohydrolase
MGPGRVVFPVSRLVCDAERFPSEEDEPMASRGMGVFYTRTRAKPNHAARQLLLNRWYWPHHSQLERMVSDVVTELGRCLIIDCHSFPSAALPYELLDQREERAE